MRLHTVRELLAQPEGSLAITDSGVVLRVILRDGSKALAYSAPFDLNPERNYINASLLARDEPFETKVVWTPEA